MCQEQLKTIFCFTSWIILKRTTYRVYYVCIREYDIYFSQSRASCLRNKPKSTSYSLSSKLPGQDLSLDNQCKALYGSSSKVGCKYPGKWNIKRERWRWQKEITETSMLLLWPCYLQVPEFESHLWPVKFSACNKFSPLKKNWTLMLRSVPCALII